MIILNHNKKQKFCQLDRQLNFDTLRQRTPLGFLFNFTDELNYKH